MLIKLCGNMKKNSAVSCAINWVKALAYRSWQHEETGYIVTLPFYKTPGRRYYKIRGKHIQDAQEQSEVRVVRNY